jgi:hypothetical protein
LELKRNDSQQPIEAAVPWRDGLFIYLGFVNETLNSLTLGKRGSRDLALWTMLDFCCSRRENTQLHGDWITKFWRQLLEGSAKQPAQKTPNPFK